MSSSCIFCCTVITNSNSAIKVFEPLLKRFFQLIYRHVEGDSDGHERIDNGDNFTTAHIPLWQTINDTDAGLSSCENCSKIVQSFCELYSQMKSIELLLNWKLWTLTNKMARAENVKGTRIKDSGEKLNNLDNSGDKNERIISDKIINLKRDLVNRCRRKLEMSFPRLVLSKWHPSTEELVEPRSSTLLQTVKTSLSTREDIEARAFITYVHIFGSVHQRLISEYEDADSLSSDSEYYNDEEDAVCEEVQSSVNEHEDVVATNAGGKIKEDQDIDHKQVSKVRKLVKNHPAVNQLGRTFVSGKPLADAMRLKIVEMAKRGINQANICRQLRVSHGCVSGILSRYSKTGTTATGVIGGSKPKVAIPRVVDAIVKYRREQPTIFGHQIRRKLLADGICSKANLPSTSSINRIWRTNLEAKDDKQGKKKRKRQTAHHIKSRCGMPGRGKICSDKINFTRHKEECNQLPNDTSEHETQRSENISDIIKMESTNNGDSLDSPVLELDTVDGYQGYKLAEAVTSRSFSNSKKAEVVVDPQSIEPKLIGEESQPRRLRTVHKCPICNKTFAVLNRLLEHQQSHENDNDHVVAEHDESASSDNDGLPNDDEELDFSSADSDDEEGTGSEAENGDDDTKEKCIGKRDNVNVNVKTNMALPTNISNQAYPFKSESNAGKYSLCEVENCFEVLFTEEDIANHQNLHAEFTCSFCDSIFNYAPDLSEHEITAHPSDAAVRDANKKIFRCPRHNCSNHYTDKILYIRHHLSTHMNLTPNRLARTCYICNSVPASQSIPIKRKQFRIHYNNNHNLDNLANGEAAQKCDQGNCTAYFLTHLQLRNHKINFHDVKGRFSCPDCNASYSSSSNLQTHQIRKHEMDYKYPCELNGCGRKFKTEADLRRHMSGVHREKHKRFDCAKCKKSVWGEGAFKNHMKKHKSRPRKELARKCVCEKCGKAFVNNFHLSVHYFSHSGPATWQFSCDVCSKKCLNKQKLNEHMRTHTNLKAFVCELCGQEYAHRHNLRIHVNSKHGDKVQDHARKFDKRNLTSRKGIKRKKAETGSLSDMETSSDSD